MTGSSFPSLAKSLRWSKRPASPVHPLPPGGPHPQEYPAPPRPWCGGNPSPRSPVGPIPGPGPWPSLSSETILGPYPGTRGLGQAGQGLQFLFGLFLTVDQVAGGQGGGMFQESQRRWGVSNWGFFASMAWALPSSNASRITGWNCCIPQSSSQSIGGLLGKKQGIFLPGEGNICHNGFQLREHQIEPHAKRGHSRPPGKGQGHKGEVGRNGYGRYPEGKDRQWEKVCLGGRGGIWVLQCTLWLGSKRLVLPPGKGFRGRAPRRGIPTFTPRLT